MATISCVLCGAPVNRVGARLTEEKDGYMCGDVEGCEQRQAEKTLPAHLADKIDISEQNKDVESAG